MIIKVENLKKKYKNQWVLKGINITIENPEIIALIGPNGAGKTTLLNCMTNLLAFDEGTVELLGKKNTDTSIFFNVSYLQDNRVLYENLSGYDHLKYICDVQKIPPTRIKEVAERIGMESYCKKKVKNYSLGMKQHLLLAMAIINQPKLLFLDEPLNGLDPTSAINVRRILLELHKEGTTIFLSSHNLDEVDRLTNTIYFMKDGELLKESLREISSNQYTVSVDNIEKLIDALENEKIPFSISGSKQLQFDESDIPLQSFITKLTDKGIALLEIEKERIGAEKRYQELFERN